MTADAIQSAAGRMSRLVESVSAAALADPTPCGDTSVGDLLDHIALFCGVFTAAARKDLDAAQSPPRPPAAAHLRDDWRISIPEGLSHLSDAWQDPLAWAGTTHAGKLPAPGALAGGIVLDELVIHGWDLARATGQEFRVDDATLLLVRSFIEQQVGDGRPIPREAVFAAAVSTTDDAPLLDQVIGLSGRDPSWRPAA